MTKITHGMGATKRRMAATLAELRRTLASLRAGRATTELVAHIRIDAWGSKLPLEQMAQIAIQPPRAIVITPHDPSLVAEIERALGDSDLGARPRVDGGRLRLEIPAPTQERRTMLKKQAGDAAEAARVAMRLARRDAVNELKRSRAAELISEGKLHGRSKDIQELPDDQIGEIEVLYRNALAAIDD